VLKRKVLAVVINTDGGGGGGGGSTGKPPVITSNGGGPSADILVAENSTAVTTVSASDPDPDTTLFYSIVGGADAARFAINSASGILTLIAAQDFEALAAAGASTVFNVTVRASDGTNGDQQALAVSIVDVNEAAPVITSGGGSSAVALSLVEGRRALGKVIAQDSDATAAITYTIAGGPDAAKFAIDAATGALRFATTPDFEAPRDAGGDNVYTFVVWASDGTLFDEQAFTVTVTDILDSYTGTDRADMFTVPAAQSVGWTILGNGGNDKLTGGAGNDVINGGKGRDILNGKAGANTLIGGTGIDTATYRDATKGVTVSLALATRQSTGGWSSDRLVGIENLTGSKFADVLTGNDKANVLTGGAGADTLDGGGGFDTASYADARAGVAIDLSNAGPQAGAGNDTLVSIEGLIGSRFADAFAGNKADNVFDGGAGDDELYGFSGNDTLRGGAGADTLFGDVGNDKLFGGAGDDTLKGYFDNDQLDGGPGADTLFGGMGYDRFILSELPGPDGVDNFADFDAGIDRIFLSASAFAGSTVGVLTASAFITGTAATTPDQRVIYDRASGQIFYDPDGSLAKPQFLIAEMTKDTPLNADDIVFF
jgi:Ca2+-binding RTX toxin-like protein